MNTTQITISKEQVDKLVQDHLKKLYGGATSFDAQPNGEYVALVAENQDNPDYKAPEAEPGYWDNFYDDIAF